MLQIVDCGLNFWFAIMIPVFSQTKNNLGSAVLVLLRIKSSFIPKTFMFLEQKLLDPHKQFVLSMMFPVCQKTRILPAKHVHSTIKIEKCYNPFGFLPFR